MEAGTARAPPSGDSDLKGQRYLVTGGAGFIGSHLTAHLLDAGDAVVVLDDFTSGRRENLEGLGGDLQVLEGSVTEPRTVERASEGVDAIAHLAALPSVARSIEDPLATNLVNATGTAVVLDVARRRGLRVAYAGSSSAYGDQEAARKHEELREDPLSPYAASKLAGELYCRSFAQVYGLPVIVTRFFNVFGPRQVADSPYSGVVAAFCFALLRGERPRIDGDGLQSRDFTYVEDVVRGVRLALQARTQGCAVVNLATGSSHTVLDLLAVLQRLAGVATAPRFAPPRPGDVRHSLADIERSRALLGYAPRVSFADGLARTFEWYRRTCA
jgi:UDP-glucose 4-epimerase